MTIFLPALTPALDRNGNPIASAVWEFYSRGTTTPAALVGGAETATADDAGAFEQLTMPAPSNYRAILKSSTGIVLYEVQSATDSLFAAAVKSAVDATGDTQSGATWAFYTTGTTTPQPVYSDDTLTVKLGSIVTADAAGRFPEIHLDPAVTYKAVLAFNGETQGTIDPVTANNVAIYLDPTFPPEITPAVQWNGAAGTGFGTANPAAPSDPTRTTAKPACRLLVPPRQRFTDELLVGVAAAANNQGALIGGIETMRFHFEGTVTEVLPRYHTFEDANGNPVTYWGYWAILKKPASTAGEAHFYAEAVPGDPAMQTRVIGPFSFFPQATLHDLELTIDPDAAATGNNYHTFATAIARIRTDNPANPRVTFGKAMTDVSLVNSIPFTVTNYITVDSDFPVTLGYASLDTTASVDSINWQRSRAGPLWIKGDNITADYRFSDVHFTETTHQWVLDGTVMTNSAGPGALWRGGNNNTGSRVTGNPWFLECDISNLRNPCVGASLVRGGVMADVSADIISGALCAVGARVEKHDDTAMNSDDPAFTVVYTGAEATATVARSGTLDPTTCTYTFKYGANSATFETGRLATYYAGTAGQGYTFADLVTWINGTLAGLDAGWSATLNDTLGRRASSGSLLAAKGQGFGDTNCKTTALQVVSNFDVHGDWWQQVAAQVENVIVYDCLGYDMQTQNIFISPTTGPAHSRDMVFYNNALGNDRTASAYFDDTVFVSQVGRSNLAHASSHVVIAHNSMPNQGLMLRNDGASFFSTTDAYCLIANSAFRRLFKQLTTVGREPGAEIVNNHIHEGQTPLPEATGTTIGGDRDSLFPNFNTGNFTPAGALLTSLKAPVYTYDINNARRAASDAVGAVRVAT